MTCCLMGPSHYLIQCCWHVVNWTQSNKWNLNPNINIFIERYAFEYSVCKTIPCMYIISVGFTFSGLSHHLNQWWLLNRWTQKHTLVKFNSKYDIRKCTWKSSCKIGCHFAQVLVCWVLFEIQTINRQINVQFVFCVRLLLYFGIEYYAFMTVVMFYVFSFVPASVQQTKRTNRILFVSYFCDFLLWHISLYVFVLKFQLSDLNFD